MEQEKKDLCLECGLCCKGSLFNAIPIHKSEEKLFNKNRIQTHWNLIPTRSINQTKHITSYKTVYPCEHLLEDNKCDIYHKRPHTCREFKCWYLGAYHKGKISYNTAINKIEEVKKIPHSQLNRLQKKELMLYPQV
jgi:Fe-S-cluster containining protein